MTEELLTERLEAVLTGLRGAPSGAAAWDPTSRRRLAHRLAEIERDAELEVHQFRALQQAVRESQALAEALDVAGFPGLADRDTRRVNPETGALIQAFNRLIEGGWGPG